MKYLVQPSTDPYFNMAFDEYCLEKYPCDEPFFYLWRNRPSVIVGLNQNVYGEVNLDYLRAHGITLARRVTGGGAVYHDLQNLNYTIVGRGASPEPIAAALRKMGVDAQISGRNDIFVDSRKVSGYARRVWHDREIVHGTLMYDVDLEPLTRALDVPGSKLATKGIESVRSRVGNLRSCLGQYASIDEFQEALQQMLADGDAQMPCPKEMLDAVRKEADGKFSTWEWIYGKSREATFSVRGKLACGTVEASVEMDRGEIVSIHFSGDFMGGLPATPIEESLRGVRYERKAMLDALCAADVHASFQGCSAAELTELLFSSAGRQ